MLSLSSLSHTHSLYLSSWRTHPLRRPFAGNYDTFVQTREEQEENQMKKYKWEQEQISNMKEYIARWV